MNEYQNDSSWCNGLPTGEYLVSNVESCVQKNYQLGNNYECKIESFLTDSPHSHATIHLVKKQNQGTYCEDCNTNNTPCEKCYSGSPMVQFRRLRTITITKDESNKTRLIVSCSCCSHEQFGNCCRNVTILLPISAYNVALRHHREFCALFLRKGYEKYTENVMNNGRLNDNRIYITYDDYETIMNRAQHLHNESETQNPIFGTKFSYFQFHQFGSVPNTFFHKDNHAPREVYNTGHLSQETGGIDDVDIEYGQHNSTARPIEKRHNVYVKANSMSQSACNIFRNDPEIENMFLSRFANLLSDMESEMRVKHGQEEDDTGPIISLFPQVHKGKVHRRLTGCNERKRHRQQLHDITHYN